MAPQENHFCGCFPLFLAGTGSGTPVSCSTGEDGLSTGGSAREEEGAAGEAVGVAGVIMIVGAATVAGLIASPISLV